ncbi:hypothetical protein Pcinc_018757 [Petrolisthes cinctipes]|uniref:Uncharacterized protein n=1 Tax=Petrolisthes cinctipes TaxID=88211 RepID=A0AAE1KIN5_PETCI|nr:hypothetical protein Pcinc_018756 [Petrolisthes cinctipes]KAK3876472.1 hypothetical protein Pcinc_018757 [Petrolisthes cinctipes]
MNTLLKIRDAPSGSAGTPGTKWPLYNCASFLLDTKENQEPTQSSFPLRSIENVESSFALPSIANDDDSNTQVVVELTFVHECSVDGETLIQEELATARFDGASSLTRWPSVQVPASSTLIKPSCKKRKVNDNDDIENSLNAINKYFTKKSTVGQFAVSMGQMVETTANQLPLPKQIIMMEKILAVIKEVMEISEEK